MTSILPDMSEAARTSRQLSVLFAAGGIAFIVLLLFHPHQHIHGFPDVVELEISHRAINEVVHGGAIALLLLLLAGHVVLGSRLRTAAVPVTVAVTAFGGGCALMTASLVLDGFVTPALALQYRAAQELTAQQSLEGLVGFCATSIGILMPLALLSFAVSGLAWCVPLLLSDGRYRIAGAASGVIGGLIGIMMSTVTPGSLDHALLASLFLIASWHLVLAFGVL